MKGSAMCLIEVCKNLLESLRDGKVTSRKTHTHMYMYVHTYTQT